MGKEIDKVSERVRQNRAARVPPAPSDAPARTVVTIAETGAFCEGDRVLDVATGQYGTVTGAGLADKLLRNDVRVALDDGRIVIRGAFGLLFRPNGTNV